MQERNYKNYTKCRDSPSSRQSRYATRSSSSSNSSNYKSSSSSHHADCIYKEANKHHWAKLQSKIKQRLMAENISYIQDKEEAPAMFIAPPATSPRQRRTTKEARKKREDKFEEYRDLFAKDFFPKGIAAHYLFLSQSIITDLERAIENITPPTTDAN